MTAYRQLECSACGRVWIAETAAASAPPPPCPRCHAPDAHLYVRRRSAGGQAIGCLLFALLLAGLIYAVKSCSGG